MKVTGDFRVGFESSRVARRRLAALAATNEELRAELAPAAFPDLFVDAGSPAASRSAEHRFEPKPAAGPSTGASPALVNELDELAQDIVATPGAGGALLASYAAQARALTMIVEAARRGGGGPLPAAVLVAAQTALLTPPSLAGLALM